MLKIGGGGVESAVFNGNQNDTSQRIHVKQRQERRSWNWNRKLKLHRSRDFISARSWDMTWCFFFVFFPSCCSFSFDCAILWSNSEIELDGKIDGKLCSAETEMERIMSEELWSCSNAQFNSLINIGAQKCFNYFLSSRHDMRGGGRSSARLTGIESGSPAIESFSTCATESRESFSTDESLNRVTGI